VRSEDEQEELLETGEIEVVQTELRAAVEGVRPQVRAQQPYGTRRTAVRKIGSGGPNSSASGPLSSSASGPHSSGGGQRHHSSLGASVSLGAINQALGAMNTEPAFPERANPVSSRVNTRLPSPTAAMPSPPPPPMPPGARRDDNEMTLARPISSPPPPIVRTQQSHQHHQPHPSHQAGPHSRRQGPPPGGIAVPTPYDEAEQTNAVMPLMNLGPAMEATDEMPTAHQLKTPPTIMAGSAAMPAAFRAQVLQQMQAQRAGQSPTAMDALIAQQLANVQRAQPIPAPGTVGTAGNPAIEATQLSVVAPPSSAAAVALTPASPAVAHAVPMPGAIRPPGSPLSAGNVDPPGTAVTARTKVRRFGNPALSWTAGLLVVGACAGAAVFVMWRNDAKAEAAAQQARSVQAAAAAQQAQMASTGTYLGQPGAPGVPGTPQDPSVITPPPPPTPQTAPYGGLPATNVAAMNTPAPTPSTTAAAAALTAAALNDGTTGMGGTLAPGNGTQPVMQLTPAQLAVMTGGAPPPAAATPAVAPAPAPSPALAQASASSGDDSASHHHHHSAPSPSPFAANDTPAPKPTPAPVPRAFTPAPAPAPKPAPAAIAKKAPAAGNDDMDSAAKALAKAQLEQSL
jgi:hypothetical protein